MSLQKTLRPKPTQREKWSEEEFNFGVGPEVNSRLYSQGQMLVEASLPVRMTAREIAEEAELLNLPPADYAVYLKTDKGPVFVPPDKTIEKAAEEAGMTLDKDATVELMLEPEFKGA